MQIKAVHGLILIGIAGLLFFFIYSFEGQEYYMVSLCILALVLLAFFIGLEKTVRFRDVIIIAVMSSVAVVARIAFFFLPQGKPLLAIVMITGISLGPFAGFTTGACAIFLSNFYFGQGAYTPFQMVAAGLCGYIAGVLFQHHKGARGRVIVYGVLAAVILYGGIVDLNTIFLTSREPTWELVAATYSIAFPLNLIQGVATGIYLFFLYHPLLKRLERIQKKYGLDK